MTEGHNPSLQVNRSPLVTFALFAFNQEKYIQSAVEGAFSQTYENMEIILSDDCSADSTYKIMKRMVDSYEGNHKVILNKNKSNLGLIEHINFINELANGELIVAAAGDDISAPHRTSTHVNIFLRNYDHVRSIHSSVIKIDHSGKNLGLSKPSLITSLVDSEKLLNQFSLIIGATHSWSRNVHKVFGPILHRGAYEDIVIAYRSALLKGIYYIDEPLVFYRVDVGISTKEYSLIINARDEIGAILKFNIVCLASVRQRRADCMTLKMHYLTLLSTLLITTIQLKIYSLKLLIKLPLSINNLFLILIKRKRMLLLNR